MTGQPMTDNASSASPMVSKYEAKPRQPNGEPAKGDASWPFSSPAATKDTRPHEIDLYIEASPRDSPTALPKLFTTLEPEPLAPAHANDHVEEDLSSTPPSRDRWPLCVE